jgi:hypothetical protein
MYTFSSEQVLEHVEIEQNNIADGEVLKSLRFRDRELRADERGASAAPRTRSTHDVHTGDFHHFDSQFEFQLWHLQRLDLSITMLDSIGKCSSVHIDQLDQLRFKVVVVCMNLISSCVVAWFTFYAEHRFSIICPEQTSLMCVPANHTEVT